MSAILYPEYDRLCRAAKSKGLYVGIQNAGGQLFLIVEKPKPTKNVMLVTVPFFLDRVDDCAETAIRFLTMGND